MLLHTISSLKKHLVPDLTVADVRSCEGAVPAIRGLFPLHTYRSTVSRSPRGRLLEISRAFFTTPLLEKRKRKLSQPLHSPTTASQILRINSGAKVIPTAPTIALVKYVPAPTMRLVRWMPRLVPPAFDIRPNGRMRPKWLDYYRQNCVAPNHLSLEFSDYYLGAYTKWHTFSGVPGDYYDHWFPSSSQVGYPFRTRTPITVRANGEYHPRVW